MTEQIYSRPEKVIGLTREQWLNLIQLEERSIKADKIVESSKFDWDEISSYPNQTILRGCVEEILTPIGNYSLTFESACLYYDQHSSKVCVILNYFTILIFNYNYIYSQ